MSSNEYTHKLSCRTNCYLFPEVSFASMVPLAKGAAYARRAYRQCLACNQRLLGQFENYFRIGFACFKNEQTVN